jgi:hypothetical protein
VKISKKEIELGEKLTAINKEQNKIYKAYAKEVKARKNAEFEEYFKDGFNCKTVMSFPASDVDNVDDSWYKKIEKFFNDNYKYVKHSGYNPETNQDYLQVWLYKNTPVEKQMELKDFIPYIKPSKDGWKHVGIFDSGCSEYDTYSLHIKDNKYKIVGARGYYKVSKEGIVFDTLEKAMDYIRLNLYYQESED